MNMRSRERRLIRLMKYRYLISGNLSLRDWSDTFGVEIEPMGVDTIGGLVIALLEHIPQKGDSVKYEDFVFTVEGVRKRRITSISAGNESKERVRRGRK